MLIPGEVFPYKSLEDSDKMLITSQCGGEPLVNTDYLRGFLATSGLPLLGNGLMREYFDDIAWRSVNALDMHGPEAARIFNRGLLFYAGVLSTASDVETVPYSNEALGLIGDADAQTFAIESIQTIQEQAPTFCDLVEEARVAMGTWGDDRLHQVSLAGAGAMHIVVVRSVEAITGASSEDLLAGHPELADLEAHFRQSFSTDHEEY